MRTTRRWLAKRETKTMKIGFHLLFDNIDDFLPFNNNRAVLHFLMAVVENISRYYRLLSG